MSFALPAILPLIGAATPAARAADVTGNYAGKPFDTSADGNSILGGSLNASFTFNGPLAANLTAADLSADIVSWTIGDSYGIFSYTLGEAQVTLVDAGFSTDANGNIIANYFETPESIEVDSDAPVGCDASGNNCGGQIVCVGSTCMSVNDWLPLATNPPVDLDVFRLI